MARRPPSEPPRIPGFEPIKLIGSGGFADVFLYQQLHPRRQVAVKVLLAENIGKSTADAFTAEANLMAQLASHPSIVSIYGADVSADGRPYLVMEYLSKPNLQARHRRERFKEVDTLRIGIQVAGAVETAHRAGILHRDIKPANILVTDYGRPALTDFGISVTTSDEMAGMSVPWSPPEAFRMPPEGDARSDVYSLAATLYTLLTDRSPFQIRGAPNGEIDVIMRIQSSPVPPIGRPDVSQALEAVLARAMSKNPADRPATAAAFARELQRVQITQHGMQETPLDVVEEEVIEREDVGEEERTRFRGITSIDAQGTAPAAPAAPPSPVDLTRASPVASPPQTWVVPGGDTTANPALDATRRPVAPAPAPVPFGHPVAPTLDATVARPGAAPEEVVAPPPKKSRQGLVIAIVAASVIVLAAAGAALAFAGGGPKDDAATPPESSAPLDAVGENTVPQIESLKGAADGAQIVFTWTNPDPAPGDSYLWRPVIVGEQTTFTESPEPTATIIADASGRACIEVLLRRADGTSAMDGVEACAP